MISPTVSVIIPNYNHAEYLPQRIESVLEQTYQDFELIILDDCSEDSSRVVIEQYAAQYSNIQTIYNTANSGSPFAQWNRGVEMARGKYVWIAESDDYADPQFLNTLIEPLNTHSNIGLAYSQSNIVDNMGQILGTAEEWTNDLDRQRWKVEFINSGFDECRYLLYKNTIPNASAVLFRKSNFLEIGGGNTTLKKVGDWLVWMKMTQVSDVYFTPQPLNYFRNHTQTTRNMNNPDTTLRRIYEEYYVVSFGLNRISLGQKEQKQVLQSVFNRMANLLPLRLFISQYVVRFTKIVQANDPSIGSRVAGYLPTLFKRIYSLLFYSK